MSHRCVQTSPSPEQCHRQSRLARRQRRSSRAAGADPAAESCKRWPKKKKAIKKKRKSVHTGVEMYLFFGFINNHIKFECKQPSHMIVFRKSSEVKKPPEGSESWTAFYSPARHKGISCKEGRLQLSTRRVSLRFPSTERG